MNESSLTPQIVLHPNQNRCGRRNWVASVEIESSSNSTHRKRCVTCNDDLLIIRRVRSFELTNAESAGRGNINTEANRLDIGFDNFCIAVTSASKSLGNESIDLFKLEVDQLRNSTDSNHVCRTSITGRFGELVSLDAEVATAFR